jgi:hypothetical protein
MNVNAAQRLVISAVALLTILSVYHSTHIGGEDKRGTLGSEADAPLKNEAPPTIEAHHRATNNDVVLPLTPQVPSPSPSTRRHRHREEAENVWQQTTRLIYADSPHLQRWLKDDPLKVYIYQSLDTQFSIQYVSRCIERRFAAGVAPVKCGYYPKVCNETDGGTLGKLHNNYNSDVVTVQRFLEYPHQTTNPDEADVLFVPYPHKSHCLCHQEDFTRTRCKFNIKWIRENVLDQLAYFDNATMKPKHLFVLGSDYEQSNPPFRRDIALDLSLGPAGGCQPTRHSKGKHWTELCGSFTMPYLNTMVNTQPRAIAALSRDWWVHRPRQYSVAAWIGTPAHLTVRTELIQNQKALFKDMVGGLPVYIHNLGTSRASVNPAELYRQSTFCPILMGDECAQKRFFDVILAGCIPVVLEFEGDEEGWPSWYNHKRCSVRRTYPFARGTYFNDMTAGLDYSSFVVSVNGTCGLSCMKAVLEHVMKDEGRLKLLRENMYKYASLFTISLDASENEKRPDAFSAIMVTLRHYLRNLVSAA